MLSIFIYIYKHTQNPQAQPLALLVRAVIFERLQNRSKRLARTETLFLCSQRGCRSYRSHHTRLCSGRQPSPKLPRIAQRCHADRRLRQAAPGGFTTFGSCAGFVRTTPQSQKVWFGCIETQAREASSRASPVYRAVPGSSGSRRGESRSSRGAAAGGRTCAAICLTSRSQSPMSSLQPLPPSRQQHPVRFPASFCKSSTNERIPRLQKAIFCLQQLFFSILLTKSPFKSISYQVFLCLFVFNPHYLSTAQILFLTFCFNTVKINTETSKLAIFVTKCVF